MQCRRPQFDSWVGTIPWRRDRLPTVVLMGFLRGSDSKESACNAGDLASIPGLGRSPGEGKGYPLQYFGLENPHGQRSLVGYSPWGHKELDMTKHRHSASDSVLFLSTFSAMCSNIFMLMSSQFYYCCSRPLLLGFRRECVLSHFNCVRLFVSP